ncbi:MAG: YqeG family HAD IIIA-type phosphatase [Coriobacteriia bacterium]|nr:YqeG family HAD IIIA-type phosphatase [Coriobacteriia bacterium]
MAFFYPDRYFTRLSDISIKKDILNLKYKYLLLDVDNTILTRDKSIVPTDIKSWIYAAQQSGLEICLISNDWHSNVVDTAKDLNLPIVVKSLKPLPHAFVRAMKKIGAEKKHTLMIGDQLLTDVLGAHLVGLKCYLLNPLVKADLIHTLVLRRLESVILRNRQPERSSA